jgi:transcription elongation factor Elf1
MREQISYDNTLRCPVCNRMSLEIFKRPESKWVVVCPFCRWELICERFEEMVGLVDMRAVAAVEAIARHLRLNDGAERGGAEWF